MDLTWDQVQQLSDKILASGLFKLKSNLTIDFNSINFNGSGNYLISLENQPYYIGEAANICKRLKQQFKPQTSTFYKNYNKQKLLLQAPIETFKVQIIATNFGRKEIEEFGIVNLPTKLNAFQLGKRLKFLIAEQYNIWDEVQNNFQKIMVEGENKLNKLNFSEWHKTLLFESAGIYLVKDRSEKIIYVGESSNIRERIRTHSTQTYFSAFRRNIGTTILGFELKEKKGKKRYFEDWEEKYLNDFIKDCKLLIFPVNIGRYELEDYLIKKYRPILNRKNNNIMQYTVNL